MDIYTGLIPQSNEVSPESVNEDAEKPSDNSLSMALSEDLSKTRLTILQSCCSKNPTLMIDLMTLDVAHKINSYGYGKKMDISFSHTEIVQDNWDLGIDFTWYDEQNPVASLQRLKQMDMNVKINIIGSFAGMFVYDSDVSDYLASECNIDVRKHWTPDYDNYFKRLKLVHLKQIAGEIFGTEYLENNLDIKKKDLAMDLSNACSGTGEFSAEIINRAMQFVPEQIKFNTLEDDIVETVEQNDADNNEVPNKLPDFMVG